MRQLLSRSRLTRDIEAIAAGAFLADPGDLIAQSAALFRVPENISTVECARLRKMPGPQDGTIVRYDPWRTPHNIGPMNSLDKTSCNLVVMPKPSRSGGTAVGENFAFKLAMFGPMGHISVVLNSDEAVTAYCRTVWSKMFDPDLNPDLAAKIDRGRGKDTDAYKELQGYPWEILSAKDSTFRNRQPIFMHLTETDAWTKRYSRSPRVQVHGRQKLLGNRKKAFIESHPDMGWAAGVAAAYEDTSRGIFVMQCPDCLGFAAAYATKFWEDVPEFKLDWTRSDSAGKDDRLELAERTAGMLCPHCGVMLTDEQRSAMIDAAVRENVKALAGWMHRGQTLDPVEGVLGEMLENPAHGFWVHALMLKYERLGKLARDYEEAIIDFERTRDPDKLREFMSKQLGEVFEGAASTGGVSPNALKKRVKESSYERGTVPPGVMFITAAVDTGGRKFDVVFIGWDLEGRSWVIDRQTLKHRIDADDQERLLHVGGDIESWLILLPQVVDRTFPIVGRPGWVLPVACTCIDSGDGNVTWKAREFARRALRAGYSWGRSWSKIKLTKGFSGKKPLMPDAPRKVLKDENGKPVEPVVLEYNIGVDTGKVLTYERLAVIDDAPGQVSFPAELEGFYVDEFFGEALIDGKWVRSGPNEFLDLYVLAEVGRQMLKPEREDIKWAQGVLPPWATPIPLQSEGGDPEAPVGEAKPAASRKSRFDKFDSLTKGT